MLLAYVLLLALSTSTSAQTIKFTSWFPLLSNETFEHVSSGVCNETLADYFTSLQGVNKTAYAAMCAHHQRCILQNLREDITARMSSANVLLGLTPGLLASLGPSVSEISLLSTQRPITSLLISLGCPAVFPSRVLGYDDARDVLSKTTLQLGLHERTAQRRGLRIIYAVVEYTVLCSAIGNIFYTSWELGTRTVVSFYCVSYILPLVWTVLSLVIHVVAASTFYTQYYYHRYRHRGKDDATNISVASDGSAALERPSSQLLENDFQPGNSAIMTNFIATFLGYLHVTFGMMIFSSLQFIDVVDVVVVILRYMASTLVSRVILLYELNEVRRLTQLRQDRRPDAEASKSPIPQLSKAGTTTRAGTNKDTSSIDFTATRASHRVLSHDWAQREGEEDVGHQRLHNIRTLQRTYTR